MAVGGDLGPGSPAHDVTAGRLPLGGPLDQLVDLGGHVVRHRPAQVGGAGDGQRRHIVGHLQPQLEPERVGFPAVLAVQDPSVLVGEHRVEAAVERHDLAAVRAGVDDAPVLARPGVLLLPLLPLLAVLLLLLAVQAGLARR